jgi:hypothetical protein
MSETQNRSKVIKRVEKEIIGPGSDIFLCEDDFKNEIIEGKPLQRYFSAILFPKQLQSNVSDNGQEEITEENVDENFDLHSEIQQEKQQENKEKEKFEVDEDDSTDTLPKYTSNVFFPSHFGISFCVDKSCKAFKIVISFGNYKKVKYSEIMLPYKYGKINLLKDFGLDYFIAFDEKANSLIRTREIQRTKDGKLTDDYIHLRDSLKSLRNEHSNSALYKFISKLFFKDKYKRYDNKIEINIIIDDVLKADNQHLEVILSQQPNCNSENWHKETRENLVLHLKLYSNNKDKYFIKAVIENKTLIPKKKFSLSKEKVNQVCCFQTEIEIECDKLLPFRDYKAHLYKTDEDKMLDYLYRDKLAFGIGHNTACNWENSYTNKTPTWIKSTFLPEYDVKSQSSQTDKIKGEILNIKQLSSFNPNKENVINNLKQVAAAYLGWIKEEEDKSNGNEFGTINIIKCKTIHQRISNGIKLLQENEKAFKSFQLANTAIYLQMFQSQQHFNRKKEGFEVWERNEQLQYKFEDYVTKPFPANSDSIVREPEWRPFQLAFILQCIASFVEENGDEKELIDLLYFPTGGGKTEAYLAVSAFLIFWRKIQYPTSCNGVNIIIRYTLRLLSAQQFERATKLILACEFIRNHHKELGKEKISIGFWIGSSSIPNKLKKDQGRDAEAKLNKLLKKFQDQTYRPNYDVNPFQLSNCQWCNTKIISKLNQQDKEYQIGHRINRQLHTHCLNDSCHFSEKNGGLPIVLIDEDVYSHPPTILFATVDKFAQLAWKGDSKNLFDYNENRKPELIIQDELHLLNGTLGSLVGLFENAILALCTNENKGPKIIASTATIKNVDKQIAGLYGREEKARVFPQYATNSDDTFFSKVIEESTRKYLGILPTGKTTVMTNLHLLASLLYARLEVWQQSENKKEADQFWTLLSYFKSLKEIGRFSNKINSELKPVIKQLQVRYLNDNYPNAYNYWKLSYRNIELTSRIPNEKIKKNLDKLDIKFEGNIKEHKAYDLVLATNMISVGLDVGRLGIMVMNGMPPNTAEYIQASSRVARKNEGLVIALYDPFNSRDLSFFEDFVQFHKTFYKQVEPLSVTPFAENALDKMLFTLVLTYFRHTTIYTANNTASALIDENVKNELRENIIKLFENHHFAKQDLQLITEKIDALLRKWKYKIDAQKDLKYYWKGRPKESLITALQDKKNEGDILTAMQSVRSVEPNSEIIIKQY